MWFMCALAEGELSRVAEQTARHIPQTCRCLRYSVRMQHGCTASGVFVAHTSYVRWRGWRSEGRLDHALGVLQVNVDMSRLDEAVCAFSGLGRLG